MREIKEKELCAETFSSLKVGPKYYYKYEESLIPKAFIENKSISECYKDYKEKIRTIDKFKVNDRSATEVSVIYKRLYNSISITDKNTDPKIKYWLEMEKAFILFWEGKYKNALSSYKKILKTSSDKYCVHFRMGELYFLLDSIEKSLTHFDEAEDLLDETNTHDYLNKYRIKLRLSYTYWVLGEEFIDIAKFKIDEAEKIYCAHEKEINAGGSFEAELRNNILWYYLERYIIAHRNNDKNAEEYFENLQEKFEDVGRFLKSDKVTSNFMDTIAWYYFHCYRKNKDKSLLKKAQQLCLNMGDKVSITTYNFRSINLQLNHIQEIMSAR